MNKYALHCQLAIPITEGLPSIHMVTMNASACQDIQLISTYYVLTGKNKA